MIGVTIVTFDVEIDGDSTVVDTDTSGLAKKVFKNRLYYLRKCISRLLTWMNIFIFYNYMFFF